MRSHVWACCLGGILSAGVGLEGVSFAAEPGAGTSTTSFTELTQIKKFVSVEVQTLGTAEKLRLKGDELTDAIRAAFLKNFPGIALEMSGGPAPEGTERLREVGFFTCEVWTVGEAYTVAYHLDCNAGSYVMPRTPGTLWNRAILGYGPKDDISETIQKGLHSMIEQFATTFFTMRGGNLPQ
ncbi:hypothetical protein ACO9S2_00105 [Nitrospira sp. NS4]|uniref:hypothetical protein n=1 Tax=Nitrospira sp. NS4 TaxID=3414498 RepID=UPI003C2DBE1D